MDIKLFYKNQVEVAAAINNLVDCYLKDEIDDNALVSCINKLKRNSASKMLKDGDFTAILKQKCGKRRLELLTKVLEMIEQ
jgi:uncharacterized protein (TIGR04540 family)